jgi:hypothetical protein
MSTAALNVCTVRETHLPSIHHFFTIFVFISDQRRAPHPRPWKNRDIDPKKFRPPRAKQRHNSLPVHRFRHLTLNIHNAPKTHKTCSPRPATELGQTKTPLNLQLIPIGNCPQRSRHTLCAVNNVLITLRVMRQPLPHEIVHTSGER